MIREIRLSKSLTQREVAESVGVARSTYAMWEGGEVLPNAKYLIALAKKFDCTVDDLLKEAGTA